MSVVSKRITAITVNSMSKVKVFIPMYDLYKLLSVRNAEKS